jgi:hypothetical protein
VRSIFDLRNSGLAALKSAIDEISGIPTTMYGRDRALNSLKAIYSKIDAIDLNEFRALEEAGLTTENYFESRMGECLRRLKRNDILYVPPDIQKGKCVLARVTDITMCKHITGARKYLRKAHSDLQLLQSKWRRILMSRWVFACILGI